MRSVISLPLSDYAMGRANLDNVRELIEGLDWNSADLSQDERSLLLGIEVRLAGLDEGLNDEGELREFISRSVPLQWASPSDDVLILIGTGTGNTQQEEVRWLDITPDEQLADRTGVNGLSRQLSLSI